ncbi:MAG: TonB-dependent receptor plug [Sediminibacterium sp.]|nr:TonB-dependent receptor plug [Sediminibacterium sp.]
MRKLLILACICLSIGNIWAQNRVVTGRIFDSKGGPVAGASVIVKGTAIGTSAGANGSFSLSVPASAKALFVSAINFESTEIAITGKSTVDVTLASSTDNLGEVVVVAYGTVKKEALTGSVGVLKNPAEKRPISNITSALEGTVPGLVTTTGNGQPGSGLSLRIRGFGSINATSEPLIVLDGAPYAGGTSNINPDDVESITVLKDAASSALYGSRAANGVVLINTKKGVRGRNNISVKVSQGFVSRGLPEYETVDAKQYYPLMWEAYRNSLVYPASGTGISLDSANRVASGLTSRTSIKDLLAYNPFNVAANTIVGTDGKLNPNANLIYGDDLDWTKDLMRNGSRKDYGINLNGGGDKSDYFVSLGYVKEEGFTVKSDLERYSARINMNVQPKTWLKTGLNIGGNYTKSYTANDGGTGGSNNFVNPFFYARTIGPIYPVYAHNMTTGDYLLDGTGSKFYDLGNFGSTAFGIPNRPSGGYGGRHVLAETVLNDIYYKRTVAGVRNYVDITFLKDFKFTNNVAVDFQNQTDVSYENTLVGDGAPAGRSRRTATTVTTLTASQLLNYGKTFSGHRIDVLAGHESYRENRSNIDAFKQGQSLSGNTELGNFTTINAANSFTDLYTVESYLSRVNYDYRGKYLLSGSFRSDGNSRFASESRWGNFWSVGAGWRIDKEDFIKTASWINMLKLRGSYGVVGVADGISLYAYQGLYGFANNANEPGIVQSQTAFLNRDLTWEKNTQFDIGVDFSLFKNRINGSFEYYHRVSSDLLFAVQQPLSSGALSVFQNTATMYNKGIELQLTADIVRTKSFTWNMGVNLSTVANKITKMPPGQDEIISGTKKFAVGASSFDYWLRSYYGVDPSDGAALYYTDATTTVAGRRIITNKDGRSDTVTTNVNNGRFEYKGSVIPDLYGSFTETFTYKGFTLAALFTFQLGGKTYDGAFQGLMSSGTYGGALSTEMLGRWQKPGDVTNIPRLDVGRTVDFNATSSRWLIDASYLNIRTVSLSHVLPSSVLSKLNLSGGQFFVSAENVAFFAKRKGMNNQQQFSGITSNAYPPARVITVGFTLNL